MLLHAQHVVPQQARNGTEYTRLSSPFRIVFFLDFRRLQVSVSLLAAITRPITVSNRVYVCADSFPLPASDGGADRTIFSLRVSHQIPRLSSFLCIQSAFVFVQRVLMAPSRHTISRHIVTCLHTRQLAVEHYIFIHFLISEKSSSTTQKNAPPP